MGLIANDSYDYWRVSDGMVRKTTTEDDPLAIKRTITKDGQPDKIMYEQVNKGLRGIIESVEVREGQFGKQLYIAITDGIEKIFLQVPWDNPYSRSFLERLPGVDLSKDVDILPYSFTDKRGKRRSGISLNQGGVKIPSYYKEYNDDFTSTKHLHGYPEGGDDMETEDWKILGIQQLKFLKKNVVDAFPFFEGAVDGAVKGAKEVKKEPTGKKADDEFSDLPF